MPCRRGAPGRRRSGRRGRPGRRSGPGRRAGAPRPGRPAGRAEGAPPAGTPGGRRAPRLVASRRAGRPGGGLSPREPRGSRRIRSIIARSPLLTRTAPMPRNPPSLAASAAPSAAWTSHSRKLAASSGVAFAVRIAFTEPSSSTTCLRAVRPWIPRSSSGFPWARTSASRSLETATSSSSWLGGRPGHLHGGQGLLGQLERPARVGQRDRQPGDQRRPAQRHPLLVRVVRLRGHRASFAGW